MNVFSQEWAAAYQHAINHNTAYRSASAKWEEGNIALVMERPTLARAVLLDLLRGECLNAQSVDVDTATQQAAFVVTGSQEIWQQVLAGKLQPLMGIMSGKLKLTKGSIARLLPYANAATELVLSARGIPTEFDE